MVKSFSFLVALTFSLLLSTVSGCGSGTKSPVSGTVTFDGKPLASGAIQFIPDDLSKGRSEGAVIKDGSYKIPADHGLEPGSYSVSITSSKPAAQAVDMPGKPQFDEELIPLRYNQKSELKRTVEKGKAQKFDFNLSK